MNEVKFDYYITDDEIRNICASQGFNYIEDYLVYRTRDHNGYGPVIVYIRDITETLLYIYHKYDNVFELQIGYFDNQDGSRHLDFTHAIVYECEKDKDITYYTNPDESAPYIFGFILNDISAEIQVYQKSIEYTLR